MTTSTAWSALSPFDIPDVHATGQVVHSLAKWKRLALKRYQFHPGKGLFTDMNAIRRDEVVDNLHSIYVDQWDWEKVILREDRTESYLRQTVRAIMGAVCETNDALDIAFPSLHTRIDRDVYFISTQELEDRFPDLTPKQREDAICREHHTVFLMQIGGNLKRSGQPHDGRAPDYDDWQLNGDILLWNPVLERSFEISSMGIRVDEAALDRQLTASGCDDRRTLPFHRMLLAGELPLTIGGGIGQSRLCMMMIGTCHIGEVQASLWDQGDGADLRKRWYHAAVKEEYCTAILGKKRPCPALDRVAFYAYRVQNWMRPKCSSRIFRPMRIRDATAHHLRLVLILQAKDVAHLQAHGGEDEGDAADEQHRRRDIHPRQ